MSGKASRSAAPASGTLTKNTASQPRVRVRMPPQDTYDEAGRARTAPDSQCTVAFPALAPAPGVVAVSRSLDLHDAGAEIAEHHRGVGPGKGTGEVDDEQVRQRSGHLRRPRRRGSRRIGLLMG
jgi:hypothetical protein